jgi:hypothetical protein
MMAAVARIAEQRGVACCASLENPMACGFGVCLGCAAPLRSGGFALVCRDGPVLPAHDGRVGVAAVSVDTRVDLGGIALRNPVLTASGTFGYGTEFAPFLDLTRIGGFVAKSLTLEPRRGNPPPRIAEAPSGMLNAISLENVGVDAFVREKLPALPDGVVVVASVFETEIERYAEVAKRLTGAARVAGLEVNASCPHVKSGGIEFGQRPALLAQLVPRCAARPTCRCS